MSPWRYLWLVSMELLCKNPQSAQSARHIAWKPIYYLQEQQYRQIGGMLRVSHPQIPFGGPMPLQCYECAQSLHQSVDALPQVVASYVNQARPEGATLIIWQPCFWDTGLSRGAVNPVNMHNARRLLPFVINRYHCKYHHARVA